MAGYYFNPKGPSISAECTQEMSPLDLLVAEKIGENGTFKNTNGTISEYNDRAELLPL